MTSQNRVDVLLTASDRRYLQTMDRASRKTREFQRQTQKSFQNVNSALASSNRVLGSLGITGTFAFGALVGGTVSSGLSFDRMATSIEISTGLSGEALDSLLDKVLEISDETTVAVGDVGSAFDRALARDIPADSLNAFVESAAQAAELTDTQILPLVDSASALFRLFQDEGLGASEAVELLYTQSQLLNLPLSEVAGNMQRLAPLADEMGISVDELAVLLSTTTLTTGDLARSTSGLTQLINEARNPTSRLGMAIDDLSGNSYQELIDQGFTTEEILRVLNDVLEAQGQTIEDVIGSPEALGVALAILAAEEEVTARVTEALSGSVNKLDEDFNRLADSTSFKLDQAMNDLKNTSTELGVQTLPLVTGGLQRLEPLIDSISGAVSLLNLDLESAADNLRSLANIRTNFGGLDGALDAAGDFFSRVASAEGRRQTALDAIRAIGRSGGVEAEFQFGGTSLGGLALVGERGPEIVNLPRGAHITPHAQRAPGGGVTNNVTLIVEGSVFSDEKLEGRIFKAMNRAARMGALGLDWHHPVDASAAPITLGR